MDNGVGEIEQEDGRGASDRLIQGHFREGKRRPVQWEVVRLECRGETRREKS